MQTLIVGGGVAGLVAAQAVLAADSSAEVVLLEQSDILGGLLSGIEYEEESAYFDIGTHIFQETGLQDLDKIFLTAIPEEELIVYPAGMGDLAGAVFEGILQHHSHFPDLRHHKFDEELRSQLRELVNVGSAPQPVDRSASLPEISVERFGRAVTDRIILPTLSHVYNLPKEQLAGFSILLPGWTRVIVDDFDDWSVSAADDCYRQLIAVPDQRELPEEYHHGRRSFYSRKNGSRAFIYGIAASLKKAGAKIETSSRIHGVDISSCKIDYLDEVGANKTLRPDRVIMATGAVGGARLLGMDLSAISLDKPMPHWTINVILEEPCPSDLCYLYGLDLGCEWYRVTNYRAFSMNPEDRRLTIEVIGTRPRHAYEAESVILDLYKKGFLNSPGVVFADARQLPHGFPAPTTKNIRGLIKLGDAISNALPERYLFGGIGANGGKFFQNEVVLDMYQRVMDW